MSLDFSEVKVLIIGDIMLDHYVLGTVERISPEAPVPVVRVESEQYRLGGAGNVLSNILALGGNAEIISVVGNDESGKQVAGIVQVPHLMMVHGRKTTTKTRILGNGQQIVRIDYEQTSELYQNYAESLLQSCLNMIPAQDVLIISDYAKGVISVPMVHTCITTAQSYDIPVIIDPKPEHQRYYHCATLMTPNAQETEKMVNFAITDNLKAETACQMLQKNLNLKSVLITRGKDGMTLLDENKITHFSTVAKDVFDVTGAGDTVVATMALAIGSGLHMEDAAKIANTAAGIAVGKMGAATVSIDELKEINDEH